MGNPFRFFQQFKNRSTEEEIIDDFSMAGEEVIQTFKTIERVIKSGNKRQESVILNLTLNFSLNLHKLAFSCLRGKTIMLFKDFLTVG